MPETPRLLFVHAHPDDESLGTGATIAHYAARGADVRVVTCTLGEEGEVIGDRWAELAVDRADQLGGYRIGELTAALRALGIGEPHYLGGAGRWRDSGMRGTPRRHRQRFIDADERETVGALVAVIREQRPHVVVTYDPGGGYGHPDHVHAHRVTVAAVAAAGPGADTDFPGEPWAVRKLYWSVFATRTFEAAMDALTPEDLRPEWAIPPKEEFTFGYADADIDAVVETAPAAREAKRAALAAHATQVVVGPTGRACALSNNAAIPILGDEHYVLAAGAAGERDGRGWETDLLAGLGFPAAPTR
ncbi:N-acetyl-1-D-myo-inositol-2-amino-2-deoxy-alpha-D-glucopyranoside deacetylase [Mycobacterium colombiense]|uniref:N-acetyl-1-D-myo-inositol-2-amino-2-deoxy-alpha- D-glucopyranoside deacetylase n=1 Tax=Mycobacterium colombiense TaxID=339268 RepID=UPI0007ECAC1F|nr:N-acetyl-1-D-myo-inositol-2-amino-2-deoxy-alpha-D-glucopyranoside deacetylase [Mycobacterium colombiense]OBJ20602.1 N-acetyl-1-D-myo-inositol-2-amino-2-deoxy-alpha-D-glucopyranoside deacetylase [Mycobacterium colombiense]OBJ33341.1 N-acetyl-1-D-myo-inositol-2-amino-2-deoxy-alpha-D-glucopyranoside deacetylase [Mycobacterium colombiense]OBJ68210.1 N-acetyl-1-D-myo-inositol-2-amino-2-deoxy-alpha-D-glucopyranoside deacetylase [Mycobacterium colombiense]